MWQLSCFHEAALFLFYTFFKKITAYVWFWVSLLWTSENFSNHEVFPEAFCCITDGFKLIWGCKIFHRNLSILYQAPIELKDLHGSFPPFITIITLFTLLCPQQHDCCYSICFPLLAAFMPEKTTDCGAGHLGVAPAVLHEGKFPLHQGAIPRVSLGVLFHFWSLWRSSSDADIKL